MNKKFEQTKTRKIPKDWEILKIVNLFNVETGSTPSTRKKEYWNEGSVNWITPTDLSKLQNSIKINRGERKITELAIKETNLTIIPQRSIIISTRAPVGYVAILNEPCTFNQGCKGLVPKDDKTISVEFYAYYLIYKRHFLQTQSSGSTFKELSKERLENLEVPFPPIPEQEKITKILGTVDEAIEKVDKAIEKTERLKKGLLQEFLTKGIGHKEFKDTEIGKIPRRWEVRRLEEVTEINKETIDPRREVLTQKFLYIDIDSIENETGKIKNAKEIVGNNAPSRARRVVYHDNVIMSTVRPYLKAFAIVPKEYDNQVCSTGFAVFACREKLLPTYLLCTLFSKIVINQCNRMMIGGQYPALNSTQVGKIKIPYPSMIEQVKIAEMIGTVDKRLELYKQTKQKFEQIKKGLMNDLLTGKKRVRV